MLNRYCFGTVFAFLFVQIILSPIKVAEFRITIFWERDVPLCNLYISNFSDFPFQFRWQDFGPDFSKYR